MELITDGGGAPYQHIRYTPYGEVRVRWSASGQLLGAPAPQDTQGFTRYESELFSGLHYAGARFYDPTLGLFLTHDPARQFANPYAYGPWDPVNGTDPNGEFWFIPAIIAAISAFAAAHPIVTAAVIGGVLGGVNAAVTGQNIGQGIALGVGLGIVGGAAFASGNFAIGMAGGAAVGAAQSAATGQNPLYGALIGAGFGAIGAYAGSIPAVPGQGFGAYLANAAVEIGTEAGIGALRGGFTALANGGNFGEGAAGGAVFGAGFGAAKVGLLGAKAQPPYTREQIEAEFNEQSKWDQSGLNLSAPAPRTYDVRVGGLIPAILRMQAVGNSVVFPTYGSMDLVTLAHELRHVAQLRALGVVPFVGEYATIIPEQIRYSRTALYHGPLYRQPGSSVFGNRLEPGY